MCNLKRVLLIPKLAYNVLSVSKASDAGKIVKFDESGCRIVFMCMDDKAAELSVRKSSREKHQTEFYGIEISHLSFQNEPVTYEEATASSDSLKWIKSMESEMKSLSDSDVWDIVPLPTGKKAVGSKWVYKIKTEADMVTLSGTRPDRLLKDSPNNTELTMMRLSVLL